MESRIEPGVTRLLRWYVGVRLALLVLVALGNRGDNPPDPPQFPAPGIVLFGVLLLVLVWPEAERRLGRLHLPLAITLATIAPIVDAVANIDRRLDLGLSPNDALADYWVPFFLLFVPFILTAWQYRYRWVLVFAAASTLVDMFALAAVFQSYEINLDTLAALLLARGFLFAFLGFFVSKLIARQRDLRADLGAHAATLERLATGRERNRLARELHDTLAHSMTATAVQLEAVEALWDADPDRARDLLRQALTGTRSGLDDARRAIEDLRASPLEEHGLAGAVARLARSLGDRSGIEVICEVDDRVDGLPLAIEQAVYRVADEATTNVERHSSATRVGVVLALRKGEVVLVVEDDGIGFDPGAVPPGHHGIVGMRERAEMIGGTLDIGPGPSAGTVLRMAAPVVGR